MGLDGGVAQTALLVFLVVGEVALEPLDLAVALEGQVVGGDGDDYLSTSGANGSGGGLVFIDARSVGSMVTRTLKEFTDEDIAAVRELAIARREELANA